MAAGSPIPLRIMVLPIFRRYWCYHAWEDAGAAQRAATAVSNIDWRKGRNLEERLQLLGTKLSTQLHAKLIAQWRDLEAAKEGSIKNRIYRLAQGVLSREEPEETFLKAVPGEVSEVHIVYPSSYDERLVRRRMRILLRNRLAKHRRRLITWSLITIPLAPLVATPIPAFPLYYAGFKAYSNYKAYSGAKTLWDCWSMRDTQQLEQLQNQLRELQQGGVVFPAASWPAKLLAKSPRYLDILENTEGKLLRFYKGQSPATLIPHMEASQELDTLIQPQERLSSPVKDEAALAIASAFSVPTLFEHVARARKRATGAMFPAEVQ